MGTKRESRRKGKPAEPIPRFRVRYWYALVAIYDTQAKGFVWHRQCPADQVPAARQEAADLAHAWMTDPQPFLLLPPDSAFPADASDHNPH